MKAEIWVVSGPSGVGKNSVLKRAMEINQELTYIPSFTTRAMRVGESEGNPYHFITLEQFEQKKLAGDLIEYANVHGNFYGTDKFAYETALMEGKKVIKDIDVEGALAFKKAFGDRVCLVYLESPSKEELVKRLVGRCDTSKEEMDIRLSRVEYENAMSSKFDFRLVNKELDETTNQILALASIDGELLSLENPRTLFATQSIKNMDTSKLERICESMKTDGYNLCHPISVVITDRGDAYVSEGHHRWIAAMMAGVSKIPLFVQQRGWKEVNGLHEIQQDYEALKQQDAASNCT